jgi:hypothetical protein
VRRTTQRQFRRWYLRARRVYPCLPTWSRVNVWFAKSHQAWASIGFDTKSGRITGAGIRIDPHLRNYDLALREFAHEVAHMVHPRSRHGPAFGHHVVGMMVVMDPHKDSY